MPLLRSVAYGTAGVMGSLNLDPSIAPFTANIGATISGTATFKMQLSLDADTVSDANALWFDSSGFPAGTVASGLAPLTAPVSRIRFDIASISGTLTIQVLQGFSTN